MKKRIFSIILAIALCLSVMPATTSAAASLAAKPWFTNPDPGSAQPASADGLIPAISYSYEGISLLGQGNSWFSYSGSDEVRFEAEFVELADITDYGEVVFNANTAPYITYTPGLEVAGQTVKFKVKAMAGAESVTGDFCWTVNVGAVPDSSASDDTSLSALTYQIGSGEPVSLPLEEGVVDYNVTLKDDDYNKTVILSGRATDSEATVSDGQAAACYWPDTASLTVTAADKSTAQTYTVTFSIPQSDCKAKVSADGITCWEDDTVYENPVYVTPDQSCQLRIDCGGGTEGYGSYSVTTSKSTVGSQYGINDYPNRWAALSFQLAEGESLSATVHLYREHKVPLPSSGLEPVRSIELTIIGKTVEVNTPVAEVTIDGDPVTYGYSENGTYSTPAEALKAAWEEAAKEGTAASPATVTLLRDVELDTESLEVPEGSSITLDGGEFTLSSSHDPLIEVNGGNFTLAGGILKGSGTRNVIVSAGSAVISGGKITNESGSAIYVMNTGNTEIRGGTVSGTYGLYVNGGTAILSGGTFTGTTASVLNNVSGGTVGGLLCEGYAYYEGDNVTIDSAPVTEGLDNSSLSSGTYTVAGVLQAVATVTIGGETTTYGYGEDSEHTTAPEAFQAAWEAAKEGTAASPATVTLLRDVGLDTEFLKVPEGSSITLDGGKFTLSSSHDPLIEVDGGSFTLAGGILEGTGTRSVNVSAGSAVINGGKITNESGSAIYVMNTGKAEILNGTINAGYCIQVLHSGTAVISGGTLTSNGRYKSAIRLQGNSQVTVSGGEITGEFGGISVSGGKLEICGTAEITNTDANGQGIFVNNSSSTVTITGGKVSGYKGIDLRSGSIAVSGNAKVAATSGSGVLVYGSGAKLTVSGGEVSGSYGINLSAGIVEISGTAKVTGTNTGINMYDEKPAELTVSGGEISGYQFGILASYGNAEVTGGMVGGDLWGIYAGTDGNVRISGGKFSGSYGGLRVDGGSAILSGGSFTGTDFSVENLACFKNSTI